MIKHFTDLFYRFFNLIYRRNFSVYQWLYFNYKNFMDRHEVKLIKRTVKPGMTVVDVGANIGFYTLILADLVGRKGMVHAFEPEPINFRHLMRVSARYLNIKANRFAVGAESGNIDLFISSDLNVDHLAYNDGDDRLKVKVSCIALDKYFVNKKVDFIKIDTQGFEHQVLLGMRKLIKKSAKIMIMAEFSAYDLSLAGVNPEEHIRLVKEFGLRVYILGKKFGVDENDLMKKDPNRAVYYNLLYVKGKYHLPKQTRQIIG